MVSVLPEGAAAKAGVESGDILEAIGDKSTREMSLAEIQSTLAGAPGSQVTVLIVRIGKPDPLKLTITRAAETIGDNVDFNIGTGYNNYFNGLIDDVRIYNRSLSAREANDLYRWGSQSNGGTMIAGFSI